MPAAVYKVQCRIHGQMARGQGSTMVVLRTNEKKVGSQMRRPATRTLLVTPALTRQKSQMDVQVK